MAGGYKNIHKHPKAGTGDFRTNPRNINREYGALGSVGAIIKELEVIGIKKVTKQQLNDIDLMLLNLTIPKLQEMAQNETINAFIRIRAKRLLSKDGFEALEKMLDRAINRPTSNVDITTKGDKIQLSETEAISRIKELESLLSDDQR